MNLRTGKEYSNNLLYGTTVAFAWKDTGKSPKTSVGISGHLAKILTRDLLNNKKL